MARQDVASLRIAIVGMGMGGLATALALAKQGFKHIDIYEYASSLAVVGAGIQLAPNMARILDRLGVWQDIKKHAVCIQAMRIRSRCSSNRPLPRRTLPLTEGCRGRDRRRNSPC